MPRSVTAVQGDRWLWKRVWGGKDSREAPPPLSMPKLTCPTLGFSGGSVQGWELGSMTLVGPSQLRTFHDSLCSLCHRTMDTTQQQLWGLCG